MLEMLLSISGEEKFEEVVKYKLNDKMKMIELIVLRCDQCIKFQYGFDIYECELKEMKCLYK